VFGFWVSREKLLLFDETPLGQVRREIGSIAGLRDQFFNEISSKKKLFFTVSQNQNTVLVSEG
jgi:hypothetical protein